MSSFSACDEIINFPNCMRIVIQYANCKSYTKCNSYNAELMNRGHTWHQIVVEHNNKTHLQFRKEQILKALFDVIDGEEMFPIAYRTGKRRDSFLVRKCEPALNKLFQQNLRLLLPNGSIISLKVQLNVAQYVIGQISPTMQINKALDDCFNNMKNGTLNLTRLSYNQHLSDIIVNLGNRSVFKHVCSLIQHKDKFHKVHSIIMKNNGITTLTPLTVFTGVEFIVLDLRDNELRNPTKLCKDLQTIKANELMLAGNPVTTDSVYPKCLKRVLNNFKLIDGVLMENLFGNCTAFRIYTELKKGGYRIDISNKNDINRFEKSSNWHAFVIPDAGNILSKKELFDNFFLMVTPTCSNIYPCYYQYDGNAHRFVVRECLDQIKHIVKTSNFEIRKSRFITNNAINEQSDLNSPLGQTNISISYYLLMDISTFEKGQVKPLECIDKALVRRFNATDRILNLNNFQNIEDLENIIVNLSSTNILSKVLLQASRKFVSACVELRLAHNQIINANLPKALKLMNNLRAIDLSYNQLHDLYDIRDLEIFDIRSLSLDGNPLCAKYNMHDEYVKTTKEIFPNLTTLDGIDISTKGGLTCIKNYLCDLNAYDFVEQFLSFYFKTFETITDRTKLKNIYHPQAILNMTHHCNTPNMATSMRRRISRYGVLSRNVLAMDDEPFCFTNIYSGGDKIMKALLNLPNVKFDFLSFTTATTKYSKQMVVITVNGIFLDQADVIMESDILLAFSRTFILRAVKSNLGLAKGGTAYQIYNDQFSVFKPTIQQTKNAFKFSKNDKQEVQNDNISAEDKIAMLAMMQELTHMTSIWCTRCLDEGNWNFEAAVKIFLDLYQNNEIPDAVFA